jgi:cytochrome b involved in lipid metabolism
MSKTLTLAEVASHDREEDCYLIIGNERTGGAKVYDVTKYLDEHPGGDAVLLELAGKYADDMFEDIGHSMNARQQLKEFLVGTLDATEEELAALRAPAHTGNGDSFLLVAVAGALIAAVGGYFVFMA